MSTIRLDPRASAVALCLLITLAACDERVGGTAADPVAPTTGTVNILLTDAPSDEFSAINVTFTRIELLGAGADGRDGDDDDGDEDGDDESEPQRRCSGEDDDGDDDDDTRRVVLFTGTETLDLLRLENFSQLFAIAPDVPAGVYCKLRLTVSTLELVERASGISHFPRLGGGKLDLLSRSGFSVSAGGVLIVEIDMDARKSIHAAARGDGYRFRPVVFVKVSAGAPEVPNKLVRVQGWVNRADSAASSLGLQLGGIGGEQITVQVVPGGVVFDAGRNAVPIDFRIGDNRASAYGRFSDVDPALFEAVLVQVGTPSSDVYATLTGTVRSAPGGATFAFELDPDQGGTVLDVGLAPETLVFSGSGEPLDVQAITAGARAEIDGVPLPATTPDTLLASLVILPASSAAQQLSGQVASVERDASTSLTLATAAGDRCVRLHGARVSFSAGTGDGFAVGPSTPQDITPGRQLDAWGEEGDDGCFEAGDIVMHDDD